MNILDFRKLIFFLWIFRKKKEYLFKKEYSGFFLKRWILYLNKYSGSSLPASKTVVTKYLKFISNHSGIIIGTYFSPFQGFLTQKGAQEGSKAIRHFFKFWLISPSKSWMNNSIEYYWLYWMNMFLNEYFGFCIELNHF